MHQALCRAYGDREAAVVPSSGGSSLETNTTVLWEPMTGASLPGSPSSVCSDLWGLLPTLNTHARTHAHCLFPGSYSPSASLCPSLFLAGKWTRLSLLSEKKNKQTNKLQNNRIPFV